MNGVLYCPNGDTGAIGDICTFSCNPGYELQGAQIGTCLMDYTWSGELRTCVPYSCPDRITTSNTSFVSLVNSTCGQTYSSRCRLYCLDGFVGEDVIYVCNITNNPTVVDWVPIGGVHSICERGLFFYYYMWQQNSGINFICIYVCTYLYIYIYIYISVYVCMYMHNYVCMYTSI